MGRGENHRIRLPYGAQNLKMIVQSYLQLINHYKRKRLRADTP